MRSGTNLAGNKGLSSAKSRVIRAIIPIAAVKVNAANSLKKAVVETSAVKSGDGHNSNPKGH
jgi:hypothetical protein